MVVLVCGSHDCDAEAVRYRRAIAWFCSRPGSSRNPRTISAGSAPALGGAAITRMNWVGLGRVHDRTLLDRPGGGDPGARREQPTPSRAAAIRMRFMRAPPRPAPSGAAPAAAAA